jgi:hypothetical protein
MSDKNENKSKTNPIEVALSLGEDAVDTYLSNVTVPEFIYHIKGLKYAYANKGVVKQAIKSLEELLTEPEKPQAEEVK